MEGERQPDMNYYGPPPQGSRTGLWVSLGLSLLFLLCILACLWLIWQRGAPLRVIAVRDAELALRLTDAKRDLEGLLALPPCEAKARISGEAPGISQKSSPPPAARKAEAPVYVNSPEDVERACVFLASFDANQMLNTGSGFYVAPGYVLTNKHLVGGAVGKVLVTSKAMGKPARGEVVAVGAGPDDDFAIVRLDEPVNAEILKFAPDIKKTEKVGAWGFPDLVGKNDPEYNRLIREGDLSAAPELSYSEGVVSAILDRNPKIIVHTAPISPGNSGGPLVNQAGEVVGLNSMITIDDDSNRQASLAIAVEPLKNFLRQAGL